jgi:tRNA-specific 2-thiouridylase
MKAVLLFSGGLDSSIAYALMREWDVEIFPLHITHTFLSLKNLPQIPDLKIIDVAEKFVTIVKNPQHGYGKNLNPCIDCRILMLREAKQYLTEIDGDFLVTGEVLGQRPMSQRAEALTLIEKDAGCEGLLVRPLSGGLLPPTIPEKNGLLDRDKFLKMKGRSRKFEFELAKKKNIKQFFSPSGGCLLTDPAFSRRLADLMRYQGTLTISDIELLKIGRHFRLSPDTKLIVGRFEDENKRIEEMIRPLDTLLFVPDTGSPHALFLGDKKYLRTAASITARYSDKRSENKVKVLYQAKGGNSTLRVTPITEEELTRWRI